MCVQVCLRVCVCVWVTVCDTVRVCVICMSDDDKIARFFLCFSSHTNNSIFSNATQTSPDCPFCGSCRSEWRHIKRRRNEQLFHSTWIYDASTNSRAVLYWLETVRGGGNLWQTLEKVCHSHTVQKMEHSNLKIEGTTEEKILWLNRLKIILDLLWNPPPPLPRFLMTPFTNYVII